MAERQELLEARAKIARQIGTLKNPTAAFYGAAMDLKPDNRQLIADLQLALDEIDAALVRLCNSAGARPASSNSLASGRSLFFAEIEQFGQVTDRLQGVVDQRRGKAIGRELLADEPASSRSIRS